MAESQHKIKSKRATVTGNNQPTRDPMTGTSEPVFAEIAEADATGRTREIYDDFKASIGLPMVNLVYRHMATTPEWWRLCTPPMICVASLEFKSIETFCRNISLNWELKRA